MKNFIIDRKDVSCEGPPPTATVIISRTTLDDFMNKLLNVTGYEEQYTCLQYTCLAVICRYLVTIEYITLPRTDQEKLVIASRGIHQETAWGVHRLNHGEPSPLKCALVIQWISLVKPYVLSITNIERLICGQMFVKQAQMTRTGTVCELRAVRVTIRGLMMDLIMLI